MGGAGFIVSPIVDGTLTDGYEFTAMDNLTEGSLANHAHLRKEVGSAS
jgi:nucleoside-diphosphate-sugar epimerase